MKMPMHKVLNYKEIKHLLPIKSGQELPDEREEDSPLIEICGDVGFKFIDKLAPAFPILLSLL